MDKMNHTTSSTSADYFKIGLALRHACRRLTELEKDTEQFVPETREMVHQRLRESYMSMRRPDDGPTDEDEDLEGFLNEQADALSEHGFQIREFVRERFAAEYTVITTMSAALIEAVINVTLQYGLASTNREDLFHVVDKWTVLEKWQYGPSLFYPAYDLPKDGLLWGLMTELVAVRNATLHYKAEMYLDDTRVFKGTSIHNKSATDQLRWLKRVANLPYALQNKLNSYSAHSMRGSSLTCVEPFGDHSLYHP